MASEGFPGNDWLTGLLVVAAALTCLWFLERRGMRESRLWRATVPNAGLPSASVVS